MTTLENGASTKNVLVLYNGQSMFTPTVQDYLDAFRKYSRHNIHYLHVYYDTTPDFDWSRYDAVLLTYSCRLCYRTSMSEAMRSALKNYSGLKAALVQDEYQETNKLRAAIRELGLRLVFTCVPDEKIAWVYPPAMFPGVRFERVLTGYVPERLRHLSRENLPRMEDRPHSIGYRGRDLGHCWGDLSFFKTEIGRRFKKACEAQRVPHDIAWSEEARIYQNQWYPFISSCRAMLGTPSGLNVFDWDGSLEREYRELIKAQPHLTYEEYRPRIASKEREIDMGQVSPRMFETVALGTALILLEGSYSGVIRLGQDCMVVKRDFSNIGEVLAQVADMQYLKRITDTAYERLIESGAWNYERFIAQVDNAVDAVRAQMKEHMNAGVGTRDACKGYDQAMLEEYALASPVQYPLTRWLDLSHLRSGEDGGEKLAQRIVARAHADGTTPHLGGMHSLVAKLLRRPALRRVKDFITRWRETRRLAPRGG